MKAALAALALVVAVSAAACGEHPCTLHVGEPAWCTATPDDAPPVCTEICGVCDDVAAHRWESACRAWCREDAGIPALTCEALDADVEARYRQCVETSDYGPCERHRDGAP